MAGAVKRRYEAGLRREQAEITRRRIVEAATRLFAEEGYSATTMAGLARAAGVAVQTIYATYGSKSAIASAIVAASHAPEVDDLIRQMFEEPDPRAQLEMCATIARRLYDIGETVREALRRAGNEALLAEWRAREEKRYRVQAPLVASLARRGVLRPELSARQAADILWALTGRDLYELMVDRRGWSPGRFERWLASVLKRELLIDSEPPAAR